MQLTEILYITIPAYNEEENIENVIDDWYPIVERHNGNGKSRLVVIDDGSKDSTYEILQSCAKKRELLCVLKKKNEGHGATILEGYQYALKHGADYIFQTDSDGQTLASEFELFWEERCDYDIVLGLRKKRQDGASRWIVSKILRFVIALIFGVDVEDANVPYRLMTADSMKSSISSVPKGYNLTNVIISVAYKKLGYRIKRIPITFRPRQAGVNSINIKRIIGIGIRALRSFYDLNQILNKRR